jgi:hypothetical protein
LFLFLFSPTPAGRGLHLEHACAAFFLFRISFPSDALPSIFFPASAAWPSSPHREVRVRRTRLLHLEATVTGPYRPRSSPHCSLSSLQTAYHPRGFCGCQLNPPPMLPRRTWPCHAWQSPADGVGTGLPIDSRAYTRHMITDSTPLSFSSGTRIILYFVYSKKNNNHAESRILSLPI